MRVRVAKHVFMVVLAGVFLSGCQYDVLHPQGPVGVSEAKLLAETTGAMLIVVIPVLVMTAWFAWRYRSSADSTYDPNWTYSGKVEAAIWGVPLAIVIALGIIDWRSTHRLDPFKRLAGAYPVVNVDVVALNWKWLFIYPDQHIATIGRLEIPVGTDVAFKITSDAPMNVFFIPQLGTQIYAMGGMQSQVHLMAKNAGIYRGLSANFSGAGFPDMRFQVDAVTPAAFTDWVKHVQAAPADLDAVNYERLTGESVPGHVAYFGQVDPKLFSEIIMQFHGKPLLPVVSTE